MLRQGSARHGMRTVECGKQGLQHDVPAVAALHIDQNKVTEC